MKKTTAKKPQVRLLKNSKKEETWINPVGGLGDTLMISGVLKLVIDKTPTQKYNLVRRTRYLSILKGHPAIKKIGFPPKGSKIIGTNYWSDEDMESKGEHAFQVLARLFGLSTPVEQKLYLPGKLEEDVLLNKIIPWKEKNVVIAPASDSPRKMMRPEIWQELVEGLLSKKNVLVIQVGQMFNPHIKNTYSLLGVTNPRQLVALVNKCDLVITSDSFIMHAAHLVGTPAIVLWGPTKPELYGYDSQVHIRGPLAHCDMSHQCIGGRSPENYSASCPLGVDNHCINKIPISKIKDAIEKLM